MSRILKNRFSLASINKTQPKGIFYDSYLVNSVLDAVIAQPKNYLVKEEEVTHYGAKKPTSKNKKTGKLRR